MPATYEPIATYTPGTVSSLTFSSIPATYTDLRVVANVNTATNLNGLTPRLQFNGDTGTNYSNYAMAGTGTAGAASAVTSDTGIRLVYGFGGDTYGLCTWDIFSYTSTSIYKTAIATQGNIKTTTAGSITRTVGTWRNTAAITSITVQAGADTFDSGSIFTLYGIKRA